MSFQKIKPDMNFKKSLNFIVYQNIFTKSAVGCTNKLPLICRWVHEQITINLPRMYKYVRKEDFIIDQFFKSKAVV